MSTFTPAGSGLAQLRTRDFDYGVGDDIDTAVQQVRTQIAARIRHAADLSPEATGSGSFTSSLHGWPKIADDLAGANFFAQATKRAYIVVDSAPCTPTLRP